MLQRVARAAGRPIQQILEPLLGRTEALPSVKERQLQDAGSSASSNEGTSGSRVLRLANPASSSTPNTLVTPLTSAGSDELTGAAEARVRALEEKLAAQEKIFQGAIQTLQEELVRLKSERSARQGTLADGQLKGTECGLDDCEVSEEEMKKAWDEEIKAVWDDLNTHKKWSEWYWREFQRRRSQRQ